MKGAWFRFLDGTRYQTLDDLLAQRARLEKDLYLELRHLFSLQPDFVFYDLTSTYFEGAGPASLARFGDSRDERPRNRQILVGLVMMDGWHFATVSRDLMILYL